MSFFGLGGSGLKVTVELLSNPDSPTGGIIPLDHIPTWKVRKNPFACLKYPDAQLRPPHPRGSDVSPGDRSSAPARGTAAASIPPSGAGFRPRSTAHHAAAGAVYAYDSGEDVEGEVSLYLPQGKKADHLGIKVQFFGRIDMQHHSMEGRPHYDFISLTKELSPPGALYLPKTSLPFHFRNIEKELETYRGRNVSVKYFVRAVVERKFLPPIHKEREVIVQIKQKEPDVNEAIKMEVGIEDCLHIEFEYERRCYHIGGMGGVILGRINFLLVRIKIKHMELAVIRRETSGEGVATAAGQPPGAAPPRSRAAGAVPAGPPPGADPGGSSNILTETQTLTKFEIMDGAPVKGETIPVRLYLRGIPADLTPTYDAVNNRFSVRYFLNLVLVDEEDRRYFKQQEIILWRKELG